MKDKAENLSVEELNRKIINSFFELAKRLPIEHALQVDNLRELIIGYVKLLLQKDLKDERKILIKKIKKLACKECSETPELDGGIVKDSDCEYNRALFMVLEEITEEI